MLWLSQSRIKGKTDALQVANHNLAERSVGSIASRANWLIWVTAVGPVIYALYIIILYSILIGALGAEAVTTIAGALITVQGLLLGLSPLLAEKGRTHLIVFNFYGLLVSLFTLIVAVISRSSSAFSTYLFAIWLLDVTTFVFGAALYVIFLVREKRPSGWMRVRWREPDP